MLLIVMHHGVRALASFGVPWSFGGDSRANSWFHMGIGEALLMVIVMIWSFGGDLGVSSWFRMGIGEALFMVIVMIWCVMVLWWGLRSKMDMCCP